MKHCNLSILKFEFNDVLKLKSNLSNSDSTNFFIFGSSLKYFGALFTRISDVAAVILNQ
jgi:hypothetical protein